MKRGQKLNIVFGLLIIGILFAVPFASAFNLVDWLKNLFGGKSESIQFSPGDTNAEWQFNEANWSGISGEVKEVYGSYNGTATGAKIASEGIDGKTGSFNGNGDYVMIPGGPNLNSSFTLSLWVKFNTLFGFGKSPSIFGKFSDYKGYGITYDSWGVISLGEHNSESSSGVLAMIGTGNNWIQTARYPVSPGRWYHVVEVYNGTKLSLYINGVLYSSVSSGLISPSTSPIYVGRHYSNPSAYGYVNGSIDEIMIYNRALNVSEISQIYNSQNARLITNITIPGGGSNQTNQTNQSITCTDSDGGLNYYVKGLVRNNNGEVWDTCINNSQPALQGNELAEYSCAPDGNRAQSPYTCPNGCFDGACIQNSSCAGKRLNITSVLNDNGKLTVNYQISSGINTDVQVGILTSSNQSGGFGICNILSRGCGGGSGMDYAQCSVQTSCNYPTDPEYTYQVKIASANCSNLTSIYNVTIVPQVCQPLIDRVKNPVSLFRDNYGLFFELSYNDTWRSDWWIDGILYNYTSYYAGWNANDASKNYYIDKSVRVFDNKLFNATKIVSGLTGYESCVERELGDGQIVYVCSYMSSPTSITSKYNTVYWANNNVLVEIFVSSGQSSLTQEEMDGIMLRDIQQTLSSIKSNEFKGTYDAFNIDYHLTDLISQDLSMCSSLLPAKVFPYDYDCKIEPIICPEYGYQNQICRTYVNGQQQIKTTQLYCSPGICSGCYVPRWFGYDNGENICIPYGTRLQQKEQKQEHEAVEEEVNYDSNGRVMFNLTIYDTNRAHLYFQENMKSPIFDSDLYVGSQYEIQISGSTLVFIVDKITPADGDSKGYIDISITSNFNVNAYCNYNGNIFEQKGDDASCQNNYECSSNECRSGQCVNTYVEVTKQASFLVRILCRITNFPLFGGTEEGYQQCLQEYTGGGNPPTSGDDGGGGTTPSPTPSP